MRRSTTVLNATTPPKADCGSEASAFSKASIAVAGHRHAAWRGVLDDGAGRAGGPQRGGPHRGVEVQDVVEGEFLPLPLLQVAEAARLLVHIERGALARDSRRSGALMTARTRTGSAAASPSSLRRQVAGDGTVVVGGVAEDLGGECPARRLIRYPPARSISSTGM